MAILEIIGNKMKFKYENLEFNQHHSKSMNYDLFENVHQVEAVCGNDSFCWLDVFNWSIMNKTKLTEDIYQFIQNRSYIVQQGFINEFKDFEWNWELF